MLGLSLVVKHWVILEAVTVDVIFLTASFDTWLFFFMTSWFNFLHFIAPLGILMKSKHSFGRSRLVPSSAERTTIYSLRCLHLIFFYVCICISFSEKSIYWIDCWFRHSIFWNVVLFKWLSENFSYWGPILGVQNSYLFTVTQPRGDLR